MKKEKHILTRSGCARPYHRVAALAAGALIFPLFTSAQGPERGDADRGGPRGGPPDPAEMAKRIMQDFDADQDGSLSLVELTASLRAMQQRHPHGPPPPGGPGGAREDDEGGRPRRPAFDQ